MTIKGVFESIQRLTRTILIDIRRFVSSDEFKESLQKIGAWLESAMLYFVNAVIGLAVAIVRFMKSEGFQSVIRRVRNLALLGWQLGLRAIRWVAHWLCEIATSESVQTGAATVSDLFELLLPKSSHRVAAILTLFVIASILVLSWPESEPTDLVSGSRETVSEPEEALAKLNKKAPAIKRIVSGMPDFSEFPAGRERKAAFFGYFLPIIEKENRSILETRKKLKNWHGNRSKISRRDATKITDITTRYRLDEFDIKSDESWNELFNRVDVVPPSLALAQSANESAWGTSRFAREGLNFFGQWCFTKGCGLVPKKRDPNKTHEVAAFDSPQESVRRYVRNLNSNNAYKGLREIRAKIRLSGKPITGHELAAGLQRYSERGVKYISELRQMIAGNNLAVYDIF